VICDGPDVERFFCVGSTQIFTYEGTEKDTFFWRTEGKFYQLKLESVKNTVLVSECS
jgi:hypothetical protein